jgi:hypothetical protein
MTTGHQRKAVNALATQGVDVAFSAWFILIEYSLGQLEYPVTN